MLINPPPTSMEPSTLNSRLKNNLLRNHRKVYSKVGDQKAPISIATTPRCKRTALLL